MLLGFVWSSTAGFDIFSTFQSDPQVRAHCKPRCCIKLLLLGFSAFVWSVYGSCFKCWSIQATDRAGMAHTHWEWCICSRSNDELWQFRFLCHSVLMNNFEFRVSLPLFPNTTHAQNSEDTNPQRHCDPVQAAGVAGSCRKHKMFVVNVTVWNIGIQFEPQCFCNMKILRQFYDIVWISGR